MRTDFPLKERYGFEDLVQIMRVLRGPGGCPWDAEQTHESIRKNLIEETYEAVEAIDARDPVLLQEELGDVLLQVIYHAAMEEEQGSFAIGDVCDGVCKKLVLRHPHIFGDVQADTAEEVLSNWEAIKQREKGQKTATETLESVPKVLPSLMRAEKIQKRAARAGMDYEELSGAFHDLRCEVDELEAAIKNGTVQEQALELGDLLFSAVNVSRFLGVDAEESLGLSCEKFVKRFAQVENLAQQRGIDMKSAGIQKLDELWQEIKKGC
ncbi:MAG: nucleoside triphosphate pyrophosphohydrolase [Oscillospiraceae bacterium]|nr:nucleoside triphosphate pyrophosphohydrolase [Oscillospiraceae bacterium]